jgi:hypothetical protein
MYTDKTARFTIRAIGAIRGSPARKNGAARNLPDFP